MFQVITGKEWKQVYIKKWMHEYPLSPFYNALIEDTEVILMQDDTGFPWKLQDGSLLTVFSNLERSPASTWDYLVKSPESIVLPDGIKPTCITVDPFTSFSPFPASWTDKDLPLVAERGLPATYRYLITGRDLLSQFPRSKARFRFNRNKKAEGANEIEFHSIPAAQAGKIYLDIMEEKYDTSDVWDDFIDSCFEGAAYMQKDNPDAVQALEIRDNTGIVGSSLILQFAPDQWYICLFHSRVPCVYRFAEKLVANWPTPNQRLYIGVDAPLPYTDDSMCASRSGKTLESIYTYKKICFPNKEPAWSFAHSLNGMKLDPPYYNALGNNWIMEKSVCAE